MIECRHVISWLTEQSRKDLLLDGTKFKTLYIIRMCTQLMKRMSKSNDTIFCGQVGLSFQYPMVAFLLNTLCNGLPYKHPI